MDSEGHGHGQMYLSCSEKLIWCMPVMGKTSGMTHVSAQDKEIEIVVLICLYKVV